MGIPLPWGVMEGSSMVPPVSPVPMPGCTPWGVGRRAQECQECPPVPHLCTSISLGVLHPSTAVPPCRWLLPPQALNAYYLPNKNQMGKHCQPPICPWGECGEDLGWDKAQALLVLCDAVGGYRAG